MNFYVYRSPNSTALRMAILCDGPNDDCATIATAGSIVMGVGSVQLSTDDNCAHCGAAAAHSIVGSLVADLAGMPPETELPF